MSAYIMRLFVAGFTLLLVVACAKKVVMPATCESRVSPAYNGPAESAICTTSQSYSGGVSITIQGRYQKRVLSGSGLGAAGAAQAIRYAEVRVLNSSGTVIQCGALDSSGNATLTVPQSASKNDTVQIFARADNSYVKASVLNCPEENVPHTVTQTFLPDTSKTVTVTAGVTGEVLGGAFNILDRIVDANAFLNSEAGICPYTGCQDFTVAPKMTAYWVKGFNPNNYQGDPYNGLSFYLQGYSRLFIMGGVDGDVDLSDTDHFDDSVILHEYGHFIEDVFSTSDSPGGQHFGNAAIDPRLAWSEGWANFLQAAIRGDPHYQDSTGNIEGSTFLMIDVPIEEADPTCTVGDSSTGCDLPEYASEGNFREFAISRYLWDIFDSGGLNTDSDTVNDAFVEIWASLSSSVSFGFTNASQAFRNIGLLNEIQEDDLASPTDLSSLKSSSEHLMGDTTDYAKYVTTGACGAYNMDPVWRPVDDNGSFATSYLVPNNDFYFYKHPGGAFNLVLTYNTTNSGGGEERESDLDLYVYNENARFGKSSDVVAASQDYFDNDQTTAETESVSKTLPAGNYLINVKSFTGDYDEAGCIGTGNLPAAFMTPSLICNGDRVPAGDPLTYTLTINGSPLCPSAARP